MSTETYVCFDASAQIPQVAPHGAEAVLGYLNSKEAADPWSLTDWLRFGHLRQFPAWVAELYTGAPSAAAQARQATAQAAGLGWHRGRAIVADMEAWLAAGWWRDWSAYVRAAGYRPAWYGSEDHADAYPCDLKWLALPDGVPAVPPGFQAKQYLWDVDVPGGVVNLSVLTKAMYEHGGQGPRHHPAAVATLRAALDYLTPHHITQKGNTVSAVDKLHNFLEDHRGELETLLTDGVKVAEVAAAPVIPAEVFNALGSAVNVVAQFLDSTKGTPGPTSAGTPAAQTEAGASAAESAASSATAGSTPTAPTVPDLPSIPGQSNG